MTDKEKAKAYDEALERAKKSLRAASDIGTDIVTFIFPELAESEDERTRMALVEYFAPPVPFTEVRGIPVQKVRDWLEKQKESLHITETCKENADSFTDEDERIRKDLIAIFELIKKKEGVVAEWNGIRVDEILVWLEKQKEPESTSASMMIPSCWEVEQKLNPDKVKLIRHCIGLILTDATDKRFKDYGLTLKDCLTWLGEQKEQKPGTRSAEDMQLLGFIFDLLKDLEWKDDYAMSKEECLQRLGEYRPQKSAKWGEEEAKVLDSIIDDYEKAARSFCGYDGKIGILRAIRDGKYNLPKPAEWSEEDEVMLANIFGTYKTLEDMLDLSTGQDRDILESMNFEKDWLKDRFKSLCPQPKQEWSDEDDGVLGQIITAFHRIANGCEHYFSQDTARVFEEKLKSIRPQPKREWSEKDEKMRKHIISDLREFRNLETDEELISDYEEEIQWLKSLPLNLKKKNEDVAKLCSNEWSEEDEMIYQHCKTILHDYGYDDWFKSLRPQEKTEWSEEDIKKIRSEEYTKGFNDAAFGGKLKEWSEDKEKILDSLIRLYSIEYSAYVCPWADGSITYGDVVNFLKSLRPSWKPSKEQMIALDKVIDGEVLLTTAQHKSLESLSEQLKKL